MKIKTLFTACLLLLASCTIQKQFDGKLIMPEGDADYFVPAIVECVNECHKSDLLQYKCIQTVVEYCTAEDKVKELQPEFITKCEALP